MGESRRIISAVLVLVSVVLIMKYSYSKISMTNFTPKREVVHIRTHNEEAEKALSAEIDEDDITDTTSNPFDIWWKNYRKSEDFGDVIKWNHYFDIYHRHFARFRNKKITMLEIGVRNGGSLKMWYDYFGPGTKIYGLDIDPNTKRFGNKLEGVNIIIGDQENSAFWNETLKTLPKFDLVIDDGGHTMTQLKVTFAHLYDHVKPDGGVYLVEDLHTAYWPEYQGGYKKSGTFIEYTKDLIDQLNADHSRDKQLKVTKLTRSTQSIHIYDSVVVFEKFPHPKYHTVTSQ